MPKGKVSRVLDGDTVKIAYGPYIRLANVNAPELPGRAGSKAREELRKMVSQKSVSYEPVGRSYGRIVAKVKVGKKDVNAAMKKKGY